MRYAVLSDIHANLPALRTAIARLRRAGVDRWLCAGDVIGYGPQPNECVEAIAELDALCVDGNHESLLFGDLPDESSGRLAREAILWTRSVVRDDCRTYLEQLPEVVTLPGLVMTHAALDDRQRYVRADAQAAEQLHRLEADHPTARFLILGHTHRQWVYEQVGGTRAVGGAPVSLAGSGRFLLNPGSVGQSRERELRPRARFMLVDVARAEASLFQESYDLTAVRRALRQHGLPYDCIHSRPGILATGRRARRLLSRLLAGTAP
jgi:predicted phosphodiesterase